MNTPITDRLIQSIDLDVNLLPYLIYSGWKQVEEGKENWIVMHGEEDIYGNPIELVFPSSKKRNEENRSYIIKAVELLTALNNDPMQLVLQNIINYDRDMLYVRNIEVDDYDAIGFSLAVNQINNLKNTIIYSASSEKDAKPYFYQVNSKARRVINEFLFGHTFAGSFGFTVEAPRLSEPERFIQEKLPFSADFSPLPVNVPYERRIVERIARGLNLTKQAEEQRDHRILLNEYTSGFNSNMCSSIVGISKNKNPTVEYRISWSPKVKPGEDLVDFKPVTIRENGYEILDYVAVQLKTQEPTYITIIGHVRGLTSSDNPLNFGTRRAVVLRGLIPGFNRSTDVVVELEREDYSLANQAHINWQTIQVCGILSRSGTGWRLLDVHDFKVLN